MGANNGPLNKRLRAAADAPSHVWTEIMDLLNEAADELERIGGIAESDHSPEMRRMLVSTGRWG